MEEDQAEITKYFHWNKDIFPKQQESRFTDHRVSHSLRDYKALNSKDFKVTAYKNMDKENAKLKIKESISKMLEKFKSQHQDKAEQYDHQNHPSKGVNGIMIVKKNAALKKIQKFNSGNSSYIKNQFARNRIIRNKNSIRAVNMDASQIISQKRKLFETSNPHGHYLKFGNLERLRKNSRTNASVAENESQNKIKVNNIILENVKHRSRSNEYLNIKSKEDTGTRLQQPDDYLIKPELIKFIKANPSLSSCLYSSSEISRNVINAYDSCISSSMTGVFA